MTAAPSRPCVSKNGSQRPGYLSSCKNGISSSNEVARGLDVTEKTAWPLLHRIRKAMQTDRHVREGQRSGGSRRNCYR